MTWTYDTSLSLNRDKVRFLTGLTDTTKQIVSDEEIAGILSLKGNNVYEAAATIADSLAAKYSSTSTLKIDGFSINGGEKSDYYRQLADQLRKQGNRSGGKFSSAFVGGVSIPEMDSVRDDSDRVPSRFEIGMDENPSVSVVEQGELDEQ